MAQDRIRATVARLTADLPAIPTPWDIDQLCEGLRRHRGRPLLVHSLNLPALPFGLWFNDGKCDHSIHRSGVAGYHRDHIILHEICHMLREDNSLSLVSRGNGESLPGDIDELVAVANHGRYSTVQEEVAEAFASSVLRSACRQLYRPVSGFEQRAAAMFGVG